VLGKYYKNWYRRLETSNLKSGPFSRVYLDAAGRKIRSVTEAFDGASQPGGSSRLIVQDADYSSQGIPLVVKRHGPALRGSRSRVQYELAW